MSLINQMLKDLEKRTSGDTPKTAGLPAAASPVAHAPARRRAGLWVGVTLLVMTVAGAGWGFLSGRIERAPIASDAGAPTVTEKIAAEVAAPREQHPVPDRSGDAFSLDHLRIVPRGEGLQVEATFSRAPVYRLVRGEEGKQLVLALPEGAMVADLPATTGLPLLRSVASEADETGSRLILSFTDSCRYEELSFAAGAGGEGQILRFAIQPEPPEASVVAAVEPVSAPQQAAPPAVPAIPVAAEENPTPRSVSSAQQSGIIRETIQPTPYERASSYGRGGLDAWRQGRPGDAEKAWRAALASDPRHVQSRDLLLRLLAGQGRQAEYRAMLAAGVKNVPDHLPYRVAYARLLLDDGAPESARQLLTHEPMPPVNGAMDLYALLATVYQRLGQYQQAADTYRQLLALGPEQSVWWMGLGIALEGALSEGQARQAYEQALSRGGLSAALQAYIRQRLQVLGSGPTHGAVSAMDTDKDKS